MPEAYLYRGSTTEAAILANIKFDIVLLHNITPLVSNFSPVSCRNVAIFYDNKLYMFASAWIVGSEALVKQFDNLNTQSLGTILFAEGWQRGDFLFADSNKSFCRESLFQNSNNQILLREFFIKPGTYDVKYHCAQTIPKTECE